MTVDQLHGMFRKSPSLDHIVATDSDRPHGLVTREDLSTKLAGRYAYALRQRKPAERMAKMHNLVVPTSAKVTALASRAMDRATADLYDPIVVVDWEGKLVGTVTIRSLMKKSIELQVQNAQGANPLTGLPGNRAIQAWIESATDSPNLSVAYADLDRFKEYNDCYGFLMGDEMIRLAARVLTRLTADSPSAHLGHVGGDDFVAVCPDGLSLEALDQVCREFDVEKRQLFDAHDLERGHLIATTRRGETEAVPIVTLSLAVIDRSRVPGELHAARLSHLVASLKTLAKKRTLEERRSAAFSERRRNVDGLLPDQPLHR